MGVADSTGADDLVVVGVFEVDGTAAAEFVVLGVGVDDADGTEAAEFVVLDVGVEDDVGEFDDDGTAATEFVEDDVGVGEDVDVSEDDAINTDVDEAEGAAGKGVALSDTVGEADAPIPEGVFDGVSLAVSVEVGDGVHVAALDAVVLGVEVFDAV